VFIGVVADSQLQMVMTFTTFNPVRLFVLACTPDNSLMAQVKERLAALYGTIDHESRLIPDRMFLSFDRLVEADHLADIKRRLNEFENDLSPPGDLKPAMTLDCGYIEHAKVVLASTKNLYHRIYLGRGVFGELVMHFKNNTFQFFPWTDPDYQSREYQEFFLKIRHSYRIQLKTMCILNREEPQ
jgi:hypothetical protein